MAEQDWVDGRYLRQRRNLNAMSITLIIFTLAGGSVKNGTSSQLPGGIMSISLEHPNVVITLAWVSLFYFMWRYWLASADLRSQIRTKRQTAYYWTKYVSDIIDNICREHRLDRSSTGGHVEYKTGRWTFQMGQVRKANGAFMAIPDRQLPFYPFVFIGWMAEAKTAWISPEFSEFYTPFFLAWFAILAALYRPLLF